MFVNDLVWLALGALLIAAGALWQMWIESGQQQARLRPLLNALTQLSKEQESAVLAAEGVRPWNIRKRRRISKLVRDKSLTLLSPSEKQLLDLSNKSGWAWSFVCVGSLATAVGAFLAALK